MQNSSNFLSFSESFCSLVRISQKSALFRRSSLAFCPLCEFSTRAGVLRPADFMHWRGAAAFAAAPDSPGRRSRPGERMWLAKRAIAHVMSARLAARSLRGRRGRSPRMRRERSSRAGSQGQPAPARRAAQPRAGSNELPHIQLRLTLPRQPLFHAKSRKYVT